jgi:hypothetical protein
MDDSGMSLAVWGLIAVGLVALTAGTSALVFASRRIDN